MNHSTSSVKHTVWECKYQVVFIRKYRKKVIYGGLSSELGKILRDLAQQKEEVVVEGQLMSDDVHMLLWITPKYSVSGVVGFIKGKSAIAIARRYMGSTARVPTEVFRVKTMTSPIRAEPTIEF